MKRGLLIPIFQSGIVLKNIDNCSKLNTPVVIYNHPEKAPKSKGQSLLQSLELLKSFIDYYDISPQTSRIISQTLDEIKSKNYPVIANLSSIEKNQLAQLCKTCYDKITEKASEIEIYIPSKDHVINPKKLKEGPKAFFKEELWNSLLPFTQRDLKEAVQAIYFELPTCAGMLIMRAVEAELRKYYEEKTNEILTDDNFLNWGNIIRQLKQIDTRNKLLDHLDYLRANFRNKLSHPDLTLDQDDVEHIFPMVISTLKEMKK